MGDNRDEARQQILEVIAHLRRDHERHLAPYLKMLYEIDASALPALRISADELGALQIECVSLRATDQTSASGSEGET